MSLIKVTMKMESYLFNVRLFEICIHILNYLITFVNFDQDENMFRILLMIIICVYIFK